LVHPTECTSAPSTPIPQISIDGEALAHDGELLVDFVAVHSLVPAINEGKKKVDKCTAKQEQQALERVAFVERSSVFDRND
jgi:DNA-binding protein YbaB